MTSAKEFANYRRSQKVIGSTDVYSRKHIDKQHDRLDRRLNHSGDRLRDYKARIVRLEQQVQLIMHAVAVLNGTAAVHDVPEEE